MFELIFAPFFLPFALFAELSFWWFILVVGLFGASQWMVYGDNRKSYRSEFEGEYVAPVILLFILFALVNSLTVGETKGWWDLLMTVIGHSLLSMVHYLLYGLLAVIPLWMLHARVQWERLNDELVEFANQMKHQSYVEDLVRKNKQLTGTDVAAVQVAARDLKHGDDVPAVLLPLWQVYRSPTLLEALDPWKNKWRLVSYVILWPFHVIDKVLGEALYRFFRLCGSQLARIASHFTRLLKYGIADNIDK